MLLVVGQSKLANLAPIPCKYQTTALALYSLTFQPDHEQIAEVTNPAALIMKRDPLTVMR